LRAQDRVRLRQLERQAEGYLELDMAEHALDVLDRLGDRARWSPHALYLRGEALRELERYEQAVRPLRRAAKADPDNPHVWLALGWCHKRTGRIDLAVKTMERAVEAEPDNPLVHYNLACYLSLAGDKERALAHLSQAFALDPYYRSLVHEEPDFDPIRSDPDFQALVSIIV
jgi:Flp pilus assembly protein TadD